ncbi:sigma-70 family RNA polymerase sigma factor [Planctomycetota bacterium]
MMKERRQIFAYVIAITRDIQTGDDLFQEVCLKALMTDEIFADEDCLLRWSLVTARYTAIDALRRRLRSSVSLRSDVMEIMAAEWPTYREENSDARIEALTQCLRHLSPHNREIVQLRYQEGLSGVDVARYQYLGEWGRDLGYADIKAADSITIGPDQRTISFDL